jgi:hypothetical protein
VGADEQDGDEDEATEGWLGTATKVAGLLAGAVAATYVLGGAILALRLLFEGFSAASVVALLGQLPRELVMSTALLEAFGPAVTVGVAAALVYGALDRPKPRPIPEGKTPEQVDRLTSQPRRTRTFVVLGVISIGLMIPAFSQALEATGLSQVLLSVAVLFALLVTFALAAAGWYLIRRTGRKGLSRLPAAAVAGTIWAGMAVIPAVMFSGALEFEEAQACTTGSTTAVSGLLVGETSQHLLLATDFEDEESVLSLPADQVTKSEYGDLSSEFICSPPGPETEVAEATAALGDHGSDAERGMATELRPWLRFDSGERWRPLEVGHFLGERFDDGSGHGGCAPGAEPPCPEVSGVDDLGKGIAYLDIHGDLPNGDDFGTPSDCARPPPVLDCVSGEDSAIYYRRTSHAGHWYWDYWWFLRYNDYTGRFNACVIVCGDHEGDWEGITLITTPSTDPEILGAIYATHKERIKIPAAALPLAGTHPIVFVARGTHASYPFRCAGNCHQYSTLAGFNLPEDPHDGAAPWADNRDESCAAVECVRPLPEAVPAGAESLPFAGAWAAWSGLWGETCHNGCSGRKKGYESSPRSPGRQIRYGCPWVATRIAMPGVGADTQQNSRKAGDTARQLAACAAQRGGL